MAYQKNSDNWDDDFEIDGSGVDAEDCEKSSNFVDKPGKYHVEIVDVRPKLERQDERGNERTPHVVLMMVVLHSVSGQSAKGSRIYHNVYFGDSEGSAKLACKLGLRLGLLVKRDGQVFDPGSKSTKIKPSFLQRAIGLQAIVEIREETFEDKTGTKRVSYKIPFNEVWSVDREDVKDVPKDPKAFEMAMKMIGKTATTPQREAVHAQAATAVGAGYTESDPLAGL